MTNEIIRSASKIVLLTLVGVLAVLALVAGIYSVIFGNYNDAAKAILIAFSNALSFVFGFYFNSKGDNNPESFAGK